MRFSEGRSRRAGSLLLVTAVCLAGCAAPGEDNNYKLLEDGPGESEPLEPYSTGEMRTNLEESIVAGHGAGSKVAEATNLDDDSSTAADKSAADAEKADGQKTAATAEKADGQKTAATADETADHETAAADATEAAPTETVAAPPPPAADQVVPGYNGGTNTHNRSNWSRVTVGPVDGTTSHRPIFFRDRPIYHELPPLDGEDPADALAGGEAGKYDQINMVNALVQPFNVGADIVLSWTRLLRRHPMSHRETP